MRDDIAQWEPTPIDEQDFHDDKPWANINRAPYDEISGVLYKRNGNIKRVRYPQGAEASADSLADGLGDMVVRWLFSESEGTQENLLDSKTFVMLQDVELAEGACSAETAQDDIDLLIYVMSGEGQLHHRPHDGSPVMTRPLRPGDAALIRCGERYAWAHAGAQAALRLLVVGLK